MSDDYDFRECDKLFEQKYPFPKYIGREALLDVWRTCYRLLRPENVDYAFKELEQRLQAWSELSAYANAGWHLPEQGTAALRKVCELAADAIRQQAERIVELERADDITMTGFNKAIDERNELQSQLSAAQQRLERWESVSMDVISNIGERLTAPIVSQDDVDAVTIELDALHRLIARLPDDEGENG